MSYTPTLDGLITFNIDDLTTNSLVVNNDELINGSLTVLGTIKPTKIIQDPVLNNVYFGNCFSTVNTGRKNTVIGTSSLSNNTTGSYNFAMGYRTMELNTTGSYNTAIGTSALSFNTTGQFNVAIGESALISNSVGQFNTGVGYGSLASSQGNNNVAIGRTALTNTLYDDNVAVGANSGFYCQGYRNTFIGNNSDMDDPAFIYDFTNSTAIGYGSLITASNQVKLGTSAETVQIDGNLRVNNGITGNVSGNLTGNVSGNLTGNVSGNLTGNVIGNLTGNVSGNITSTGTSNFNNANCSYITTNPLNVPSTNQIGEISSFGFTLTRSWMNGSSIGQFFTPKNGVFHCSYSFTYTVPSTPISNLKLVFQYGSSSFFDLYTISYPYTQTATAGTSQVFTVDFVFNTAGITLGGYNLLGYYTGPSTITLLGASMVLTRIW